ncbi:MAG: PilZ domain-containing protein [Planctomycetota bacterium]
MKHLSAENLLEIVRSLRSDVDQAQRRRQPRVGMRHTVRLIPCDPAQIPLPEHAERAWVRDVSRKGLGLLVGQTFELDQTVLLEISSDTHGGIAHLLGRVVRCEEISSDNCHVGIELILDTPQDEIAKLTDRIPA